MRFYESVAKVLMCICSSEYEPEEQERGSAEESRQTVALEGLERLDLSDICYSATSLFKCRKYHNYTMRGACFRFLKAVWSSDRP